MLALRHIRPKGGFFCFLFGSPLDDEHVFAARRRIFIVCHRFGKRCAQDLLVELGQLPTKRDFPVAEGLFKVGKRRFQLVRRFV